MGFKNCSLSKISRNIAALLISVLLVGCGSSGGPVVSTPAVTPTQSTSAEIAELLSEAEALTGNAAAERRLAAIERLVEVNQLDLAEEEFTRIPRANLLPDNLRARYAMVRANISEERGDSEAAIRWLTGSLTEGLEDNSEAGASVLVMLGDILAAESRFPEAVATYSRATPYLQNDSTTAVFDALWDALKNIDDNELNTLASTATNYELRGWIELERVYRDDEHSIRAQLDSIAQWRRIWSSHSASRRLPAALAELESTWSARPRHIALILPLQQPAGVTIQEGFFSAYYEALNISREVPQVSVFDSSGMSGVDEVYDDAIASGADLVIGPLNKQLVNQLAARDRLPVPTLALNYADDQTAMPANLYQFGLAPEDDIQQLSRLAWEEGHRNAAVVTPQSDDYIRLRELFAGTWESMGGEIVSYTSFANTTDYSETIKRLIAIDSSEARAEKLLQLLPRSNMEFVPRRRQDIDFIFLVANPNQGRLIKPTLAFYFAEDIPVYSLPSIFDGSSDSGENRDLNGIWFSDTPWLLQPEDSLKQSVSQTLRPANGPSQRLRALGIDSFRLYARLEQFASGLIQQIPGTTGLLSMREPQRIHREVSIARFENGRAVPQQSSFSSSSD